MAWPKETVEELKRREWSEGRRWIEQRTVFVCELAGGDPVPLFTAVLLRVADRHFAITAGHCLKDWGKSRYVIGVRKSGLAAEVQDDEVMDWVDLTTVQAEIPTDPTMDFALIPLTEEMASNLSRFRSFVRISEVDVRGDEPPAGHYAILGYPLELRKRAAARWICDAIFYPTAPTSVGDRDPSTTIALFLDVEHTDEDGDRARLPELKGISGCGVWRLHTKGDDPRTWSVDRIRFVGIEYGYVKAAILGVRALHVMGGIATQFPELEPCLKLIGLEILRPRPPE